MPEPNGSAGGSGGDEYHEKVPQNIGSIERTEKEYLVAEDLITDVTIELLPPDPVLA